MTFRKSILLLISLSMIASLVACSSSSAPPPPAITVSVSPLTANVVVSTTQNITATTNDTKGVTWTAACGTVAPTSSQTGVAVVYTAPATVPTPATCVVTATSVTDTSITAAATFTITAVPAITVTLSTPPPSSMVVNATAAVTATVANDPQNLGVAWTVTCGSAGACGSFNPTSTPSGTSTTYTAPGAVPTGNTVTVIATSVANPLISANAVVTITAAPVITVTLSTVPASLEVGATQAITATVANDPQNLGVNWTVTCGSTGACGSFNPAGTLSGVSTTYSAPINVPTGNTVTIIATSVANPLISADAVATITPPPGLTVTLSTPPPSSMAPSATANIIATVGSDPFVANVNWSCTPVNTCGSFNPTQTGSGYATVYTAPATTGNVVITAASVTDYAISASATVTITTAASGTLTPGNYVFSMSGTDANFDLYSVSGVFTLAGDGSITGEQDFVDYTYGPLYDAISSPSGSVSPPDAAGNVIITLNTGDICIGPGAGNSTCSGTGTETLVATLVSNSKAVVAEYDTWATSSGTLDLQDSTAAAATPSAGYAFYLSGVDYGYCPLAIGGVINVDGPGTISGTGSIFDANDCASGSTYAGETLVANDNTVSAPDGLGRVTFTLNPTTFNPYGFGTVPYIAVVGYIVDATHIRLVETSDTFYGFTGGTAFAQGSNTGNFSSVSGKSYVVGLAGFDDFGVFQAAGLLTAGATTFSGLVNYNDLTGTGIQPPDPVTEGTQYTVDSTGRVSIPGMTDGVTGGASFNLQLYLDGNGNALAITLDDYAVVAGPAYQQTGGGSFTAASFTGSYAMDVSGADLSFEDELDAVGPIAADGIGAFTGSVDLNWFFTDLFPDLPVSGTFTAAASGVFSSTTAAGSGITGLDLVLGATQQDAFAYYVIDPTKILAIETDPNQLTLGFFLLQQ